MGVGSTGNDLQGQSHFPISVVAQITEIAESTIRMWERRYGFPRAERTSGGHRRYSRREIARLQWVKQRIDEGARVSQAIKALTRQSKGSTDSPELASRPAKAAVAPALADLVPQMVEALVARDTERATSLLKEASLFFPVESLVMELVGPAIRMIGTAWHAGRIELATEHFATQHLRQYLLGWMQDNPPSHPVNPIVLACAPKELHEGGLLMLAVLLRRLGWPVLYLGQSMRLEGLETFLEEVRPPLVIFTAMTDASAVALAEWPLWLPRVAQTHEPLVCFGGTEFVPEALVAQIPGLHLGPSIQEALSQIGVLLHDHVREEAALPAAGILHDPDPIAAAS